MPALVVVIALLTFLHYAAAQMRGPVLPLYAAGHGASATGVGIIVGAHMAVAAIGSIPLGRAADVWGRRRLLLGGMAVSLVTSLLLPFAESTTALAVIYGLAGLGVAAFSPSALALVADAAPPARTGQAFAWFTTAHYGAIAVGPFLGGVAAEWYGYPTAFVASAIGVALALVAGAVLTPRGEGQASPVSATFADIRGNAGVWAGWIVSASGLAIQGTLFTFYPLLAHERGLTPAAIGFVFLVLGLANTLARVPAGWLVDRTRRPAAYAIAGMLLACAATVALPHLAGFGAVLALVAVFGAVSGIAFVAISVALAGAASPGTRGLVMGGYSTSLYGGLALGSFGLGPVVAHAGYDVAFVTSGVAGAVGTLIAAGLWATAGAVTSRSTLRSGTS